MELEAADQVERVDIVEQFDVGARNDELIGALHCDVFVAADVAHVALVVDERLEDDRVLPMDLVEVVEIRVVLVCVVRVGRVELDTGKVVHLIDLHEVLVLVEQASIVVRVRKGVVAQHKLLVAEKLVRLNPPQELQENEYIHAFC